MTAFYIINTILSAASLTIIYLQGRQDKKIIADLAHMVNAEAHRTVEGTRKMAKVSAKQTFSPLHRSDADEQMVARELDRLREERDDGEDVHDNLHPYVTG